MIEISFTMFSTPSLSDVSPYVIDGFRMRTMVNGEIEGLVMRIAIQGISNVQLDCSCVPWLRRSLSLMSPKTILQYHSKILVHCVHARLVNTLIITYRFLLLLHLTSWDIVNCPPQRLKSRSSQYIAPLETPNAFFVPLDLSHLLVCDKHMSFMGINSESDMV